MPMTMALAPSAARWALPLSYSSHHAVTITSVPPPALLVIR